MSDMKLTAETLKKIITDVATDNAHVAEQVYPNEPMYTLDGEGKEQPNPNHGPLVVIDGEFNLVKAAEWIHTLYTNDPPNKVSPKPAPGEKNTIGGRVGMIDGKAHRWPD